MVTKRQVKLIRNQKKPRFNFGRYVPGIMAILFLGVVVFVLFFSGLLAVLSVQVNGVDDVQEKDLILARVNYQLEGKYLGVVNRNNSLLIRRKSILEDLKKEFKRIENIKLVKKFPDSINIIILQREEKMVLCNLAECHIIDEKGIAFDTYNPEAILNKDKNYLFLKDLSNAPINPNETVMNKASLDFISSIKEKLRDPLRIEITDHYETPNRVAPDVRVETTEGWKIYFNRDIGLNKEVEMLAVVLKNQISEENRTKLEYIDLRSDNRVFFKYKEGVEQETETKVEGEETAKKEESKDENNFSGKKKGKKKK